MDAKKQLATKWFISSLQHAIIIEILAHSLMTTRGNLTQVYLRDILHDFHQKEAKGLAWGYMGFWLG